ncbi:MAG TPA: hypothetical protein PLJ38_07130, partial [bacterium]|nr:hypothetical protein [bacterium]
YITEKNCEIIVLKKYKNKIENIEHLSVWLNMHTGKKMALLFDDCFAENIINDLKKNYVMLLNNDCEIYEFFKNNKEQIEIIVFVNLKKTLKKRVMNILKLFDILKIQPKLFIFFDK